MGNNAGHLAAPCHLRNPRTRAQVIWLTKWAMVDRHQLSSTRSVKVALQTEHINALNQDICYKTKVMLGLTVTFSTG